MSDETNAAFVFTETSDLSNLILFYFLHFTFFLRQQTANCNFCSGYLLHYITLHPTHPTPLLDMLCLAWSYFYKSLLSSVK